MRVLGGNGRAARMVGISADAADGGRVLRCGCAIAGLGGMIDAAAIDGKANNSLIAGYGYTGILVSFIARHNPLLIVPTWLLLGGIGASGGLVQRRLGLPYASVLVLQGTIFLSVLMAETLRGRGPFAAWRVAAARRRAAVTAACPAPPWRSPCWAGRSAAPRPTCW